jgi:thioesterase domain-containing protein
MHSSPAILRAFVATGPDPALLTGLRSLTIAGEAAHGRDVEAARALLPATCVVRNRYGSSETGLIAEYPVPADHPVLVGPLPVGRPVGDTVLTVIDEDGRPLPDGEAGVLTITSSSPASGYWNDLEATAACFRDNPDGTRTFRSNDVAVVEDSPNGTVFRLLGRRDHSVKIRGHLVEPGEVDAELFTLPEIVEAVTVAAPRPGGETQRLIAYVVSRAEQPSAAAVRKALRARLPGYMVPEVVQFLAALPRTDRGKLDRAALPEPPPIGGPETYAPMTDWEQAVADVWAWALELESVGPDQDFFELGGDSLAAEAVLAATASDLDVPADRATAATLVEAPTVREYAARVGREPDRLGAVLVPLNPLSPNTSDEPPVFFLAGGGGLGVGFVALARALGDRASYALQMHGMERRGVPDWTVARAARRNIAAIRTVQPHGPYVLAGHSYGGLVAFEMAHRLRDAGEDVALLAILDSFPPDPRRHPPPEPRPLLRRVKAGVGLLASGWATTPGTGNYWRFYDMTSFIGRHYRRRPYPGRTAVLVAQSPEREDRAAWADHLTGDWELVEVPGDHLSMLREPYVAQVAEALRQLL